VSGSGLRVAQVLTASTGGIGRHVASLAPRLAGLGVEVTVFCPKVTARSAGLAALAEVRPLGHLAQARRADVVHAHGYKAGALAAAATLLSPTPLVVTWHNAILGSGRAATAGRVLQRSVARSADLTLGASSDLVDEALRLGARRARLCPVAAPVLPPQVQLSEAGERVAHARLCRTVRVKAPGCMVPRSSTA